MSKMGSSGNVKISPFILRHPMKRISKNTRRNNFVPGTGNEDADIMILGEAPGRKEDQRGEPFVGRAGMLLNELLGKAGLIRDNLWITNVVKERPKNNNISQFVKINKKGVKMTEDFKDYLKLLQGEIRNVDPNVVVPMGKTALWALTGNKKITKWRGSILECIDPPEQKVIPTLHPAAALRQYLWKHHISFDLRRIKEEAETPEINLPDNEYYLAPSFEEAMEYLDLCHDGPRFAFDIEVSGTEVSCISFSAQEGEAMSIPFIERGREYFTLPQEVEIWKRIGEALEDPEVESIGHNVTFDATFLLRKYGIKARNLQDTMIAQAINYPDFPKGLGFVTSIYTRIPYYKDAGKSLFKKQQYINNRDFWRYNAKDSVVLMEAFPKQLEELEQQDNLEVYDNQRKLVEPLLFMTEHGLRVNNNGLSQRSMEAEADVLRLKDEIAEVAGKPLNPNSSKQLKEFFYEERGHDAYKSRSTGRPTTNETALKRLARKDDEPTKQVARKVLEARGISKMKGTYWNMKMSKDGRLRSSINPVGTKQGRLSSSKDIFGRGGNVQNLPYEFRKYVLPDEGYVGYEVDLAQAENRVVAWLGKDEAMMEAFSTGVDIHSKTAAEIFGGPVDKEYQTSHYADIGDGQTTQRKNGKRANHAFNYALGERKFALMYEIPVNEGKRIRNKYLDAYPGVQRMWEWVEDQLQNDRRLTNPFGRTYFFLDRWGNQLFKQAYSYIPQSTVADVINRKGVREVYEDQETYGHVDLLSQVHDSIWLQIPYESPWEKHAQALWSIKQAMEKPIEIRGESLSIPADIAMYGRNFKDGTELDPPRSPDQLVQMLEGTYEQMMA